MRAQMGLALAVAAMAGMTGAAARDEVRRMNGTLHYQPGRSVTTAIPLNPGTGDGRDRATARLAAKAAANAAFYAKLDGRV